MSKSRVLKVLSSPEEEEEEEEEQEEEQEEEEEEEEQRGALLEPAFATRRGKKIKTITTTTSDISSRALMEPIARPVMEAPRS